MPTGSVAPVCSTPVAAKAETLHTAHSKLAAMVLKLHHAATTVFKNGFGRRIYGAITAGKMLAVLHDYYWSFP